MARDPDSLVMARAGRQRAPWYQMFDEAETLLGAIDDGIMLPFEVDPRLRLSEMIHKYGHHIRRLRITHIWILECCLQVNLRGVTMLYWRIHIREYKYIQVDGPREFSISQGLPASLECEPDLHLVDYAQERDYVSRCFWALISSNHNLTLVDTLGTARNKLLRLKSTEDIMCPLPTSLPWLGTLTNIPMPTESISRLKRFAPNLGALTVAALLTASDFLAVPIAEAVQHHLRSLALYGNLTLNQVRNIFQTFPNLEQAKLLPSYNTDLTISHDATTSIILMRPIHLEGIHLRQLEVSSLDWAVSFPDLLTIHFPTLESIKVVNLKQFKYLNTFVAHCAKVRSVQIDFYSGPWGDGAQQQNQDGTMDDVIEPLISLPNVKVLRIARSTVQRTAQSESLGFLWRTVPHLVELSLLVSTPPLLAALAQCCPALRRVNVGSVYTLWNGENSSVVELLTPCSDLRALEGVGLKIGPNEFRNSVPLVCHKIETLHLAIMGLGDETRREWEHESDDDDDDSYDGDEKYALQHVVYDQLAQLTRL